MDEFVLEDRIYQVKIAATRDYLREIISTYQHGDYRSCIVSLYVVTVFDLLERIRILAEMYGNTNAQDFMDHFKTKTAPGVDAKYSDLEKEIIQKATELQILTDIGKRKVEELRTLRHDCAHPAINAAGSGAAQLYMPNRDEVRAKIRTMFEILFLKDPSVMRTVLEGFEDDLLQANEAIDEEKIPDYLLKRYYKRMNIKEKERLLYSPLWYKAFLENRPGNNRNRRAYYIAIRSLIQSDPASLVQYMCDNPDKFSGDTLKKNFMKELADEKAKGKTTLRIFYLSGLAFHFPGIVKGWTAEIRTIVENWTDRSIGRKWRTHFLYNSMQEHAASLLSFVTANHNIKYSAAPNPIRQMYQLASEHGAEKLYHPVITELFFNRIPSESDSLNGAYYSILAPALPFMDEDTLLDVVTRCMAHPVIPKCLFYEDAFLPGIRELAEKKAYQRVKDALTEKTKSDGALFDKETLAPENIENTEQLPFQKPSDTVDDNQNSESETAQ